MPNSTFERRLAKGGWTAAETARIADWFGVPVSDLFAGPGAARRRRLLAASPAVELGVDQLSAPPPRRTTYDQHDADDEASQAPQVGEYHSRLWRDRPQDRALWVHADGDPEDREHHKEHRGPAEPGIAQRAGHQHHRSEQHRGHGASQPSNSNVSRTKGPRCDLHLGALGELSDFPDNGSRRCLRFRSVPADHTS